MARGRDTGHNHSDATVLKSRFACIALFTAMAIIVLIRFVCLNLSMVFERRTFRYQNYSVLVIDGVRYRKIQEKISGEVIEIGSPSRRVI